MKAQGEQCSKQCQFMDVSAMESNVRSAFSHSKTVLLIREFMK